MPSLTLSLTHTSGVPKIKICSSHLFQAEHSIPLIAHFFCLLLPYHVPFSFPPSLSQLRIPHVGLERGEGEGTLSTCHLLLPSPDFSSGISPCFPASSFSHAQKRHTHTHTHTHTHMLTHNLVQHATTCCLFSNPPPPPPSNY